MRGLVPPGPPGTQLGTLSECPDADDWHRDRVLELVDVRPYPPTTRLRVLPRRQRRRRRPPGPAPAGSACSVQTICHGCDADGFFLHEPEPIAANLRGRLPAGGATAGADIGFVLDPDADRLALIDETGRYIGEELTLALAVLRYPLRHGKARPGGHQHVHVAHGRGHGAASSACRAIASAVGEANVGRQDASRSAPLIGGEGNGGVIDPRVGLVRDPFIGMGLILNLMADTGTAS